MLTPSATPAPKQSKRDRGSIQSPRGDRSPKVSSKLQERIIGRLELAGALALTAFILFLHVYQALKVGPFWRDEVSTIYRSILPSFAKFWAYLPDDSFPALIFGIVRAWITAAHNETSLRILGALIGVGILAALWLNKKQFGYRLPLVSLALLGLNPTVIHWGDSIRGYGLGLFLIMMTFGLIWKVVESPTRWRVAAAIVSSVLSVQCMYQNAFLLLAISLGGFAVLLRHRAWKRAILLCGIGMIAALSLIPYVPIIRAGAAAYDIAKSDDFNLAYLITVFQTAWSVNKFVDWIWIVFCASSVVAAIFLIFAPANKTSGTRSDKALFSLTVLVASTILFFFFLRTTHLQTMPWYYLVLLGMWALCIDLGVDLVARSSWIRILRLALFALTAALVIPNALAMASIRQTTVDRIATFLAKQAGPGDTIVVNPCFYGVSFQHYYHGKARWSTVPPLPELPCLGDCIQRQLAAENPLGPLLEEVETSLRSGHRIWYVGNIYFPAKGQTIPVLPPAPNGPHGWWAADYVNMWMLQTTGFLQAHTNRVGQMDSKTGEPINELENPSLLVFEGWRP